MELIFLLAELIPCLLIGYLLGRFKENISLTISRPLINYVNPITLIGILLNPGLQYPLIQSAAIALVAISIQMSILSCFQLLRKYISNLTLHLGCGFGNTGYFGKPGIISITSKSSSAL